MSVLSIRYTKSTCIAYESYVGDENGAFTRNLDPNTYTTIFTCKSAGHKVKREWNDFTGEKITCG